jgi:hypothetical protein
VARTPDEIPLMASVPTPPPPPPPIGTEGTQSATGPSESSPPPLPPEATPAAVEPVATPPASLPPTEKEDADHPPLPPVKIDPLAALLSYLIPGLGQVYQGRIGKGLLFFFGLYTLFFYGMAMGQWRNVWLPETSTLAPLEIAGNRLSGVPTSLWYRPQFLGQFWIGTAAWPAVVQYVAYDRNEKAGPVFGTFQRTPTEEELNELQRNGNKRWDLGWVYTVIAGVLNLLVIYDALAGPMFREPPPGWKRKEDAPEHS